MVNLALSPCARVRRRPAAPILALLLFGFCGMRAASAYMHGVAGPLHPGAIRQMGADSLRTYDAGQLSDELKSCGHGLDILAGIAIDPGEPTDAAVGRAVDFVNANKGIPCIKYWVIGNELENAMGQGAAFAKINAVAGAVKYADPSRRTTSCVAGVEDGRPVNLKNQASNIDVPCINCYQCADTMCARLTGMGFGGEYILGEYGVYGWWEVPKDPNSGIPLEQTSTQKAQAAVTGFQGGGQCNTGPVPIGAFAFVNDFKMETTPTWFSLWSMAGQPAADRFHILSRIWSNSCPNAADVPGILQSDGVVQIESFSVDNSVVSPGQTFGAIVKFKSGRDCGGWQSYFEILPDVGTGPGSVAGSLSAGNVQVPPTLAEGQVAAPGGADQVIGYLNAPGNGGTYRVYVHVTRPGVDGFAVANAPIVVR